MTYKVIDFFEARSTLRPKEHKTSPAVKLREDAQINVYLPSGNKLISLDVSELRVVHWVGPEVAGKVREIETNVASLGYKVGDQVALPPSFVDCLVLKYHSGHAGGYHKYTLRKQFYEYMNAGFKELGVPNQASLDWRIEVWAHKVEYLAYDRSDILDLK